VKVVYARSLLRSAAIAFAPERSPDPRVGTARDSASPEFLTRPIQTKKTRPSTQYNANGLASPGY